MFKIEDSFSGIPIFLVRILCVKNNSKSIPLILKIYSRNYRKNLTCLFEENRLG